MINNPEKILPTVIILISFTASVVYFCCVDIRRGIYWLAAAVLNAAVTF